MDASQAAFIEFMVRAGVLDFGEFTTKSGRKTPYFVNTGRYRTGAHLLALGEAYADAIEREFGPSGFECLFGPAYKGIPLVACVATALARRGRDIAYCFNRKEAKDYGEGGVLVGHAPRDGERILIVEDVTTAGTSIRETVPVLRAAADVVLAGLIISVDRQERGPDGTAALPGLSLEFDMPTAAIVTLDDIVAHLSDHDVDGRRVLTPELLERIAAYRAEYGA